MAEGPLGRDLLLVNGKRTIIVLVGIDGPEPPRDVQISLEESVNRAVNGTLMDLGADVTIVTETVNLTTSPNPTREQRGELGMNTLHVQQYDISTELEEVSQRLVNRVHNTVVDEVTELGFNIAGTKTTVA